MTDATFITTFRAADPFRLENLMAVERYYAASFPELPFLVIEQDRVPHVDSNAFAGATRHIFTPNPGAFNKSWGINVAFRQSRSEMLILLDADMLIAAADLQRAVTAVMKGIDIVRPYARLIDLSLTQSEAFRRQGELPDAPSPDQGFDREYLGESICLAGGLVVVRRDFFERIGGFDETFRGWGGEDDAFSIKADSHTNKSLVAREAVAWHLWHPRNRRSHDLDYHNNLARLEEVRRLASLETAEWSTPDWSLLGRLDRYQ